MPRIRRKGHARRIRRRNVHRQALIDAQNSNINWNSRAHAHIGWRRERNAFGTKVSRVVSELCEVALDSPHHLARTRTAIHSPRVGRLVQVTWGNCREGRRSCGRCVIAAIGSFRGEAGGGSERGKCRFPQCNRESS